MLKSEQMILQSYRDALREDMSVIYSVPFRVESEDQKKTSHYFIHATNHRRGFKIMTEVMWTTATRAWTTANGGS